MHLLYLFTSHLPFLVSQKLLPPREFKRHLKKPTPYFFASLLVWLKKCLSSVGKDQGNPLQPAEDSPFQHQSHQHQEYKNSKLVTIGCSYTRIFYWANIWKKLANHRLEKTKLARVYFAFIIHTHFCHFSCCCVTPINSSFSFWTSFISVVTLRYTPLRITCSVFVSQFPTK